MEKETPSGVTILFLSKNELETNKIKYKIVSRKGLQYGFLQRNKRKEGDDKQIYHLSFILYFFRSQLYAQKI